MTEAQAIPLLNKELSIDSPTLMDDAMRDVMDRATRRQEILAELQAQNPALNFVTALIMAGDMMSAEEATRAVKAGTKTASDAVNFIGSYARFQWAVANLEKPELLAELLRLWQGSDPDDTNLEYLKLFRERAASEKRGYASDGLLLPRGKQEFIVYRGQQLKEPLGFSWTLDKETAVKFANGAGQRRPTGGGVIYNLEVGREYILAYITGRGEAEIIVDVEKAGLV